MTDNFSKVKEFLLNMAFDIRSEDREETILVITNEDKGISNLILDIEDELLVIEQFIFQLKHAEDAALLRKLLEINRNLVHGALTLDDDLRVIFRDTLQLENMDLNELEASINALSLMMAEYAEEFMKYAKS